MKLSEGTGLHLGAVMSAEYIAGRKGIFRYSKTFSDSDNYSLNLHVQFKKYHYEDSFK
jgi:hypothetical protein